MVEEEPPYGMYACASPKCYLVFVHDPEGWFSIWEHLPNSALDWGVGGQYATWQEISADEDCFNKPLVRIKPVVGLFRPKTPPG